MAKFLDGLVERHDATAAFLCNDANEGPSYERAVSAIVMSATKRVDRSCLVPNRYWSPQQMLSLSGCCRMTVSTRSPLRVL